MDATEQLVKMASALQWSDLDHPTRHETIRHLLDTVGVMVAGASGDVADRAASALASVRATTDGVPVPGRVARVDILDAAYLGGTGAHGIELDDGYREGTVHPGVCVVPAVTALGARRQATGVQVLEAVVAGYEAVIAVARACHPTLRERGFHPTGAAGVFGSAVGAGRLLDLSPAELGNAIGLAASSAGSLFAFLAGGGDVKRLHAGQASRDGLMAALLAAEGVEGPPAAIEGVDGFAQAFAGGFSHPFEVAPGGRFGIADCYVKPYPCCRHLQPAAEAIFILRDTERIAVDDIEAIEVETYAIAAHHAHTAWDTFAGAQLSFPYICALAARDGAITMASFDDANRADAGLARLAGRVHVGVDAALDATYPADRPARVTIVTGRGRFTHTSIEALGSDKVPLDDDGLAAKFRASVDPVLGPEGGARLLDALWSIEGCPDVGAVIELAVPRQS